MKINGFHKLTLVDYPGKLACSLFLFGCNFKCGFCHNPELVTGVSAEEFTEKEILDFLAERKKYLDGVCITGGEPLLSLDKEFLKKIKDLGYSIKIDTNGTFPEKLKELIFGGLVDFVSMDIKSSREKYSEIISVNADLGKIEESMKLISNLENYEFRTTILEEIHNAEEIKKMLEWVCEIIGKKIKTFVLQGFKNNGKFIDMEFKNKKDTTREYLEELKKYAEAFAEKVEIRV